ncbi:hypothetical protein BO71DRAFT_116930 [Aspergillus ellipticus CBS 707.79]|uniref:Uncharacterized protein n=1 Tax=Aspergillus ellipticus CBS 707.79 TaxID=1448320 RepID=A0A319F005_9EURO|nr:hypothetical protein BO71DRAFT_116930 [Aspergillus ellipticus CBS 707.79]
MILLCVYCLIQSRLFRLPVFCSFFFFSIILAWFFFSDDFTSCLMFETRDRTEVRISLFRVMLILFFSLSLMLMFILIFIIDDGFFFFLFSLNVLGTVSFISFLFHELGWLFLPHFYFFYLFRHAPIRGRGCHGYRRYSHAGLD